MVVSRGSSQTVTRPSNFYFFVKNPFLRTAVLKPQIYVLPPLVWAAHEPQVENPPMQIARKGSLKTHAPPGLRGAVREGFFPAHRRPPPARGLEGKASTAPLCLPEGGWRPGPAEGGYEDPHLLRPAGASPPHPLEALPGPEERAGGSAGAPSPRLRLILSAGARRRSGVPPCPHPRTCSLGRRGSLGMCRAGRAARRARRAPGLRPPPARCQVKRR